LNGRLRSRRPSIKANDSHRHRLLHRWRYDLWARVLARHYGKYIPGNPTIIVQNMPGAASIVATNYLYNVAKPTV